MKLLERNHPILERPVKRSDPATITEITMIKLKNAMARRDLEVLAAPQIGIEERLLIGRIDGNVQAMVNPRIVFYDEDDYYYLKVPRLHGTVDFTCRYWNRIILEWDGCGDVTFTEQCDMYGLPAALFQSAIQYLEGNPPWKFEKQVDW